MVCTSTELKNIIIYSTDPCTEKNHKFAQKKHVAEKKFFEAVL